MRIYFAAPLFSEAELEYNERVCGALEDAGHSVFLPQRDGTGGVKKLLQQPGFDTVEEAQHEIFRVDRNEVLEADVLTAILDGQVPDEGVAIEIAIAHENDIPAIGLKTDRRNDPLNAMVFSPLEELVETPQELLETVNDYAD
jgi:nucleoside 2-deoxyribosyltransferase